MSIDDKKPPPNGDHPTPKVMHAVTVPELQEISTGQSLPLTPIERVERGLKRMEKRLEMLSEEHRIEFQRLALRHEAVLELLKEVIGRLPDRSPPEGG